MGRQTEADRLRAQGFGKNVRMAVADLGMGTGLMLRRDVQGAERVHDWANCKDERHERLFAIELVLAYEFGDPEPLAPRRSLSPQAAQRLRDEFAALIAETGLRAGRHAHRNYVR